MVEPYSPKMRARNDVDSRSSCLFPARPLRMNSDLIVVAMVDIATEAVGFCIPCHVSV